MILPRHRVPLFWQTLTKTAVGCWEWDGPRTHRGYGRVRIGRRMTHAHRIAYQPRYGVELSRDQVVRHTCDNPPCINPDHLVLGSQADNVADMISRGRGGWQ